MSYLLRAALDVNAADGEGDAAERISKFLRRVRGGLEDRNPGEDRAEKRAAAQARARTSSRYHNRKERDSDCLFTGCGGVGGGC